MTAVASSAGRGFSLIGYKQIPNVIHAIDVQFGSCPVTKSG